MKLDDRDITCERSYDPLTPAELMAEIELYTDIALNSPLRDSDPEEILGPARALLARVEAAEALAYERLEAALFAEQRATDAELAQKEAEAAGEWRPVTEDWPEYHERVLIGHGGGYDGGWYAVARRTRTDDKDIWVMDDDTVLAFESASVAMIVPPLPPAEATE